MRFPVNRVGGAALPGLTIISRLLPARRRSGFTRQAWLAALACLALLAGSFYLNARAHRNVPRAGPVDPNSPEEREYRRLLRSHLLARNEIIFWIRTDLAGKKSLAPPPNALMKSRIIQRLEPLIVTYQDYLKRNPGHVRAGQSLLALQEDLSGESGLIKQWEQVGGIDPRDPDAWRRLGNYYAHLGEIKKSFQCYAKAIELDPTEPVYYQDYAVTVFLYRRDAKEHFAESEQQVFDRALGLYEQALKLDPKNAPLALEIAQCYYIIRPARVAPALQAWQRVLKLANTEQQRENIYLNLARVEITGEHFESARRYLTLVKNRQLERIKDRVTSSLLAREKSVADNAASAAAKARTGLD
jgi:tetratricopeptide (TPR) repeat protein